MSTTKDHLLDLLDSTLSFDTSTFLRDIINVALLAENPYSVLNRFKVQGVTHCKECPTGYQHEMLILELIDTSVIGARPPFYMCLERTASVNQPLPPPSYFTDHPDSTTVMESVVQALKETPGYISNSFLRSNTTPSSDYQLISEGEPIPSPRLPFFDAASVMVAKAIHTSLCSSVLVYKADDRFTGAKNLEIYAHAARNVRQIRPHSVSLFEFALLADTVHNHDPLYSTLKSQCYWYVRMVCDVLRMEYSCVETLGVQDALVSDAVTIPPNNHYLPNLAGRCVGILISTGKVEETVAKVIHSKFIAYREEKRDEVCFIVNSERYLLKPR